MQQINEWDVSIKRSNRRTISICIENGKVSVSAPQFADIRHIQQFINQKKQWIQKQLLIRPYQNKEYIRGEIFLFLGQSYALDFSDQILNKVSIQNNQLIVSSRHHGNAQWDKVWIFRQLSHWYRGQAQTILQEKTAYFAKLLGLHPVSVTVKHYKSRWGSCCVKGTIQYNWLLIMAPECVIDYVVVHEISHLKHHNHSAVFWQLVASVIPDYKVHRAWLKEQGRFLRLD